MTDNKLSAEFGSATTKAQIQVLLISAELYYARTGQAGGRVLLKDAVHAVPSEITTTPKTTDEFLYSGNLNEWQKVDATYGTGVFALEATDIMRVSHSGGDYTTCGVTNRNSQHKNVLIDVKAVASLTNTPHIHLREVDNDNFLMCWISSSASELRISTMLTSSLVTIKSVVIPSFSVNNNYRLVVKIFGNQIFFTLLDDSDVVVCTLDSINANFALDSHKTALGCGASGGIKFDDYASRKFEKLINIVALGDSNTETTLALGEFGWKYPQQINNEFINDEINIISSGVSGDRTTHISARLATDLTPRYNPEAKNIVTMNVGINDIVGGAKTASQTFADLVTLWNEIKAEGFELWALTVPPYSGNTAYNNTIRELNNLIKNSDIPDKVINVWGSLVDPTDDDLAISGTYKVDNIHMNSVGSGIIADLVMGEIYKLFTPSGIMTQISNSWVSNI